MSYKVYLAGPITGQSYENATDWREDFTIKVSEATHRCVQCFSPMRGKHYLQSSQDIAVMGNEKLGIMSGGPAVLARDFYDVKTSELIVVNLLGASKVSIGSMFEVAWAHALQIPVVLIIEDDFVNVHTHSMLFAMCGFKVNNIEDAISIVTRFLTA